MITNLVEFRLVKSFTHRLVRQFHRRRVTVDVDFIDISGDLKSYSYTGIVSIDIAGNSLHIECNNLIPLYTLYLPSVTLIRRRKGVWEIVNPHATLRIHN